ncbi:MAG: hypothetical protein R3B59_01275 [Dehalococcoidia bacterium]
MTADLRTLTSNLISPRRVRILAAALASEFRSPVRAADEARFVVRRRPLDPGVIGIYVPPPSAAGRPFLLLDDGTQGADRLAMYTLAIAHYYLGHRALAGYVYGRSSCALFLDPVAEEEARVFVSGFRAAGGGGGLTAS